MPEPTAHDAFRRFVAREREAKQLEQTLQRGFNTDELVERGLAIASLTIAARHAHTVRLRCAENVSRFRTGDRLELTSDAESFTGTVIDLSDYGRNLQLTTDSDPSSLADGPWVARGTAVDIFSIVSSCLDRLKPGAPGFWFFRALADVAPPSRALSRTPASIQRACTVLGQISPPLDPTQAKAFRRCVERPPIYAIQGPPGTGKTRVLALVAEELARARHRTLVLAPTHQAVNNVLSTVRNLFPQRRTLKVGDPLRHEALHAEVELSPYEDGSPQSQAPATPDTITGMTFATALTRLVLRRSGLAPHVILIDEAAQLPLAHGVTAGLIGASSVVLFGDDQQMPPVFPADLSGDPLALSVFARVREVMPQSVLMLDITYRLNEALCSLIGRSFYADANGDTQLKPSPGARHRPITLFALPREVLPAIAAALDPAHPLVWVRSPVGTDEQYNPTEARFVADLIVTAMRAGIPAHDLAVVTPFRRQVALVRSLIQEAIPGAAALPIVDTVERVQGLTVEIVVVSLSASSPTYADALRSFLQSPNRMNVAVSRARSKVVIVAAPSALANQDAAILEPFVSILTRSAHLIELLR
jgi:DNA replication ATP-dependent helicase/nuclease Dna2